jgi:hypothetical protein
VANPDPKKSIISKFVSIEERKKSVELYYPNVNFPSEPAIDHLNKYGGWKMNPSRVFWSNGERASSFLSVSILLISKRR